jgi:hypothetical protein
MMDCALATFSLTSATTAFFASRLRLKVFLLPLINLLQLSMQKFSTANLDSILSGTRHLRGLQKLEDRGRRKPSLPLHPSTASGIKSLRMPTVFDNPVVNTAKRQAQSLAKLQPSAAAFIH